MSLCKFKSCECIYIYTRYSSGVKSTGMVWHRKTLTHLVLKSEYFYHNKFNTLVAEAMAPCITKPTATMALTYRINKSLSASSEISFLKVVPSWPKLYFTKDISLIIWIWRRKHFVVIPNLIIRLLQICGNVNTAELSCQHFAMITLSFTQEQNET